MTKNPLTWCASVLMLALAAGVWMVATEAASALRAIPIEIQQTRTALLAESQAARAQLSRVLDGDPNSRVMEDRLPLRSLLINEIDSQASALQGNAAGILTTAISDADKQIEAVISSANDAVKRTDSRAGDILARADKALSIVDDLRTDAKPVLVNTAALVKDAKDSLDDSYDDIRGLLDSSTVAATQAAQTLQVVNATAPKMAADISGIAADFHDATHSLDTKFFHPPPQTKWQHVRAFFGDLKALAVAALRGGVL